LIEIVIVAAIISLFAAMAVFAVAQFYDSQKRKAMFDETRTVGVAIGLARDDIGFYPRLSMLGLSLNQVSYSSGGAQYTPDVVLPAMDTYGYLSWNEHVAQIVGGWQGPYASIAETRKSFTQGAKLMCKMRLPESAYVNFTSTANAPWMGNDVSLVDWPCDVWGNPYMVYLVKMDLTKVDATNNPYGLRLIGGTGKGPTESADYWSAVVSYGPNGIPGGTSYADSRDASGNLVDTQDYKDYVSGTLTPAMLYVPGDAKTGASVTGDGMKIFTLKSAVAANGGTLATPWAVNNVPSLDLTSSDFKKALPGSISANSSSVKITYNDYDQITGKRQPGNDPTKGPQIQIGIRDSGSDDIFWIF
jgi:type II secretory pathway pseudopilin PulG